MDSINYIGHNLGYKKGTREMNLEIIILAIITVPIWACALLFIIYFPLFLLHGCWVASIDEICWALRKAQEK